MVWSYAAYSEIGNRVRNEDDYRISERTGSLCITLADGLGGHGGGKIAASAVTAAIEEAFVQRLDEKITEQNLTDAFALANERVRLSQTPQCRMQATCVSLWICKDKNNCFALWGHVGDSRLYYFHKGKQVSKTKDHSLKELWRGQEGKKNIDVERSIIWKSMGGSDECKPDVGRQSLDDGRDAFLLCSDGVWECVSDRKIKSALRRSKSPQDWIDIISASVKKNRKHTPENNTAVAIFVE